MSLLDPGVNVLLVFSSSQYPSILQVLIGLYIVVSF